MRNNKISVLFIILIVVELIFFISYRFSNNFIFENRFETEKRYFESRGVLKLEKKPKLKVAVLGGSSAYGYGSTINFTEILNNMSILSDSFIQFDNHATPATPFYLYQSEKLKMLINNYDVFIIYAGHNEWLHFDHKKKFFPNNTKTTDYQMSKKYWVNLLDDEIKVFNDKNYYQTGGNFIFNKFTDKIRILNFTYRTFERFRILILKNYYKNFVKPKEKNTQKIRYFYNTKFFNDSDFKSRWLNNFKNSIFEIEKILPNNKKIILVNPLTNLLTPPIGDYDENYDEENEKKIANLYKNLQSKKYIKREAFEKIKIGSHKNYLLGMYCLENLSDLNNERCLSYLKKSKELDQMPWTISKSIKNYIVYEAQNISKKIEVVNILDFEKKLTKDRRHYQNFFLDYVHPSKYGHSYLANKLSKNFFQKKVQSKLVLNKKMPKCPIIEYYVEDILIKKMSTSERQCDRQSKLIKNWHNEFKSFTKSESHFISDRYFVKDKF